MKKVTREMMIYTLRICRMIAKKFFRREEQILKNEKEAQSLDDATYRDQLLI